MSRVLVCGGRSYSDAARFTAEMDYLHRKHHFTSVIHGGANGADRLAERWARANEVPWIAFAADWQGRGRAAGPHRNREMLYEGKPALVVAFAGGRGTAHMISIARAAGVPTIEIDPLAHGSREPREAAK